MDTNKLNLEIPVRDSSSSRGGFKEMSSAPSGIQSDNEGPGTVTWPRAKRTQSSLDITSPSTTPSSQHPLMSKYHPARENTPSPRSPQFIRSPRTPQTPMDSTQHQRTPKFIQLSPLPTPLTPGFTRIPSPLAKSDHHTSLQMYQTNVPPPLRDVPKSGSFAIELPGSLLLASQGYPQTFPPGLPPRVPAKASRGTTKTSYDSNASTSDSSESSGTEASSETTYSDMADRAAIIKLPTPPPRDCHSSPPSISSIGTPPPVPLTRMSLEELMKILPTLDAAIIANDWVPCVTRRHEELKSTMQSFAEANYQGQKNVTQLIKREFERVNSTIPAAEKVINDLQELVKKDPCQVYHDLEFARMQARLARAREEQMQARMAQSFAQHNRDLEEVRMTMKRTVGILGEFIKQNMQSVVETPGTANSEEILQIIANNSEGTLDSNQEVPARMLKEAQESQKQTTEVLEETRQCVYEQQNRLNSQERQLEEYAGRFAGAKAKMDKAIEEQDRLRKETSSLREQLRVQKAIAASHQLQANITQSQQQETTSKANASAYVATVQEKVQNLEAENSILRTKLSESRTNEQKLMLQQRDLIQYHQSEPRSSEPPQRGRLMRIITGDKDSRSKSMIKGSTSMFSLAAPPKSNKGITSDTSNRRRSTSASRNSPAQVSLNPSERRESLSRDRSSLNAALAFVSSRNSSANSMRPPIPYHPERSATDPGIDLPLRKYDSFMSMRKDVGYHVGYQNVPTKSTTHPPVKSGIADRLAQIPAYVQHTESSGQEQRPTHIEHEAAPAPEVYVAYEDHSRPKFVPEITATPPPAEHETRSRSNSLTRSSEITSSELFLPRSTYSPRNSPSPRPPKALYPRVLSGITEVSESTGANGTPEKDVIHEAPGDAGIDRKANCVSPSVTIADQEMYRERMRNLARLQKDEQVSELAEFNFI